MRVCTVSISSLTIRIDVEDTSNKDNLARYARFFTENERMSAEKGASHIEIWTKKEALLKCMGKGFHRAAKSVDVCGSVFCEDGHTYHMQTTSLGGYTLSVCVMDGEAHVETETVKF